MSGPYTTPEYGLRLLEWLPNHWRVRDGGDLTDLLAVYGDMLDAMHATIHQHLYDGFPDKDEHGNHCQDWLIPYFARLLDVQLVSPDADGRREEVAKAVYWRQRKGTRVSVEGIAEAVGQFEVEVQEGWKRVVMTPRIDRPLLPEQAYGEQPISGKKTPALHARHPGLPASTPDFRYCSRAVQCPISNDGAAVTSFPGVDAPVSWRQANRFGLPIAPDSYQDLSRRTVDLRTPDAQRGHYHPRRLLLHLPPPEGFFSRDHVSLQWQQILPLVNEALVSATGAFYADLVEVAAATIRVDGKTLPLITVRGLRKTPVRVRGLVSLETAAVYRFANLWFDNRVDIHQGVVQCAGCALRHLRSMVADRKRPVIVATNSLFKRVEAARGLVRLEYVTVLETLLAEALQASDCILLPSLAKDRVDEDVPGSGCLRFSRIPFFPKDAKGLKPSELAAGRLSDWLRQGKRSALSCSTANCTTQMVLFCSDIFGEPGCGVLHSRCHSLITAGAEDGGEMGAYHGHRYVLRRQAVLEKLREFLPVGMEAVLVLDSSLACVPPKAT
ncbi:MAG: phage tail protein [Desulfobulbus sp.]|nr:phage tail protein [Desulfobulbus sp.]